MLSENFVVGVESMAFAFIGMKNVVGKIKGYGLMSIDLSNAFNSALQSKIIEISAKVIPNAWDFIQLIIGGHSKLFFDSLVIDAQSGKFI